jgi:hypothetical protein
VGAAVALPRLLNASTFGFVSSGIGLGAGATFDNTGSNLMVAALSGWGPNGPSITGDTLGNTWVGLSPSGNPFLQLYYSIPTVFGSLAIATTGGSQDACVAACFSNAAASPYEAESSPVGSASPASLTPAQSNELVISGAAFYSDTYGNIAVSGSGMIRVNAVDAANGGRIGCGLSYVIQTAAAASTPVWSPSVTVNISAQASFKSTSSVGAVKPPHRRVLGGM